MERIKSKEEIEKKQKRIKFIVGGVFIFLMVFSTAGFSLYGGGGSVGSSEEDSIRQTGPVYNGQYWVYNLENYQLSFTNYIGLAEKVPNDASFVIDNYAGVEIFIDAGSQAVITEISNNLVRVSGRMQRACYGSCEEDLPEKGCDVNLIVWSESDNNRVYQEENCVFIEGDLIAVDSFLYKIFGLI